MSHGNPNSIQTIEINNNGEFSKSITPSKMNNGVINGGKMVNIFQSRTSPLFCFDILRWCCFYRSLGIIHLKWLKLAKS